MPIRAPRYRSRILLPQEAPGSNHLHYQNVKKKQKVRPSKYQPTDWYKALQVLPDVAWLKIINEYIDAADAVCLALTCHTGE